MKINKTILAGGILLTGLTAFANAHGMGGQMLDGAQLQTRFQNEATLLGVSVDEVKNAWANDKSIFDLAAEKGIVKETLEVKLKEQRNVDFKSNLSKLVASGTITQAQADQKYNKFVENTKNKKQDGGVMKKGRQESRK